MLSENECPQKHNHTPSPEGYLPWFEWAEKKARRHVQVRCKSCGRWAIWKRRAKNELDYGIKKK